MYNCFLCGEIESKDSKHHLPERHVAFAYHKNNGGKCYSCNQDWQCEIYKVYVHKHLVSELKEFLNV